MSERPSRPISDALKLSGRRASLSQVTAEAVLPANAELAALSGPFPQPPPAAPNSTIGLPHEMPDTTAAILSESAAQPASTTAAKEAGALAASVMSTPPTEQAAAGIAAPSASTVPLDTGAAVAVTSASPPLPRSPTPPPPPPRTKSVLRSRSRSKMRSGDVDSPLPSPPPTAARLPATTVSSGDAAVEGARAALVSLPLPAPAASAPVPETIATNNFNVPAPHPAPTPLDASSKADDVSTLPAPQLALTPGGGIVGSPSSSSHATGSAAVVTFDHQSPTALGLDPLMEASREAMKLRAELLLSRAQRSQYEEQSQHLLSDVEEKGRVIADLRAKLSEAAAQATAGGDRSTAVELQLTRATQTAAVLAAQLTAMEARAVSAENQVVALTQAFPTESALTGTIEALTKQLQTMSGETLAAQREVEARETDIERLTRELNKLRATVKGKDNVLTALSADATALRGMMDRATVKIAELQARLADADGQVLTLTDALATAQFNARAAADEASSRILVLTAHAEALQARVAEGVELRQRMGDVEAELRQRLNEQAGQLVATQRRADQAEADFHAVAASKGPLEQELASVKTHQVRMEALVHALSGVLEECTSAVARVAEEFRVARTPVVLARTVSETLTSLVQQLHRRLGIVLQDTVDAAASTRFPLSPGGVSSPSTRVLINTQQSPLSPHHSALSARHEDTGNIIAGLAGGTLINPVEEAANRPALGSLPLMSAAGLEDFEPAAEDPAALRDQLVRLRALFVDTQRALFAAKSDASLYERELTSLRWRNVTMRLPSSVLVEPVSSVLGEVSHSTGDLRMRSPRAALEEYSTGSAAARTAAMLSHAHNQYSSSSGGSLASPTGMRAPGSPLMTHSARIAQYFK